MSWQHTVADKIHHEAHIHAGYLGKWLEENEGPVFQTSRIVYDNFGAVMIPSGFKIKVTGISVKPDEIGGVVDFTAGSENSVPGQISADLACIAFDGMEKFLSDVIANNLPDGKYG